MLSLISPESVEEVIAGCGLPQGLQGFNIGRIMVLLSQKLPDSVNGVTVSRTALPRHTVGTTILVGYANDSLGYLCTETAIREGGYEASRVASADVERPILAAARSALRMRARI